MFTYILVLAFLLYVVYVRHRRYERIEGLLKKYSSVKNDPQAAFDIMHASSKLEHPLIFLKSLDFAFFRVLGIPTLSKIIKSTGEMVNRCGKRYDDTDLIIREFTEHSLESDRAKMAIRRMNYIHSNYPIENKDMLYTLALFICEPPKWIDKYGWRKLTYIEIDANYEYWKEIGIRMGIKGIPPSYDDMVKFAEEFEAKHMVYSDSNPIAAEGPIRLFISPFPPFLHSFVRRIIYCLLDDRFLMCMGYPKQPFWLVYMVIFLMKARALFVHYLMLPREIPTTRTPDVSSNDHFCAKNFGSDSDEIKSSNIYIPRFHPYEPNYLNGYKIDELGSKKVKSGKLGKLGTLQPNSILKIEKVEKNDDK